MPEQYTYQVGKINFIVTPVYHPAFRKNFVFARQTKFAAAVKPRETRMARHLRRTSCAAVRSTARLKCFCILSEDSYKDKRSGETMKDILLKLMLADMESGDILNIGGKRRYNILGNTDCPTPEEGGRFETVG